MLQADTLVDFGLWLESISAKSQEDGRYWVPWPAGAVDYATWEENPSGALWEIVHLRKIHFLRVAYRWGKLNEGQDDDDETLCCS